MSLLTRETAAAYELVYRYPLFDYADENGVINACIILSDGFSEEYFKAAVWSTQREGFRLNLDIIAEKSDCDRLISQYPEIFCTDSLSDKDEIFCRCRLFIFAKEDLLGGSETALWHSAQMEYAFIFASGEPAKERFGVARISAKKTLILTDSETISSEGNITLIPKNSLDGDSFLKHSGIEQTALSLFLSFEGSRAESFYENAEYYRSSVASALFWTLRRQQGESISVCESNMRLEHRRWNAYTRTEGYRYGKERSDKDKTHPCLVAWNMLSDKMQQADANPIRAAGE